VACNREPGQSLKLIATDFGIAESCLRNWLRQGDVEDRPQGRPGVGRARLSSWSMNLTTDDATGGIATQ
jgi:transposase-like protein